MASPPGARRRRTAPSTAAWPATSARSVASTRTTCPGPGTLYHIQIEDRGPVADPVLEREVRRVNVIVYANYGEPNARIIYGRDHDFEDIRSQEPQPLHRDPDQPAVPGGP